MIWPSYIAFSGRGCLFHWVSLSVYLVRMAWQAILPSTACASLGVSGAMMGLRSLTLTDRLLAAAWRGCPLTWARMSVDVVAAAAAVKCSVGHAQVLLKHFCRQGQFRRSRGNEKLEGEVFSEPDAFQYAWTNS